MIMTLDITRVQKVDKCPMIMTSQISCQGQGSSSVISVSSSLPLGTCPQSLGGNFSMDAGFGNQTSVDDSEQKRPRLRLAWTDSWYLLENNDSSPHSRFFQRSVKNTNTVNTNTLWSLLQSLSERTLPFSNIDKAQTKISEFVVIDA